MKKILVINLGWEQEPLLDELEKHNVEIYGIHNDLNYYKKPKYKDVLVCNIRDLEKILSYAKKINIDAVISDECDYSYFAQATVAEALNLPGPRIKEAQLSINKYLQRKKCEEYNILIPKFKICSNIEDVYEFTDKYKYPIIIKPIDNRGSFGVNKVNHYGDISEAYINSLVNSHSRLVIVEEFIEGTHITVDGYSFENIGIKSLAIAKKRLASKERQVAMDIQYPAIFEEEFYKQILETNENVNNLLGYSFGMTHSEYMITENNKIYLIESANRGGGVYTSEIIVPEVSGINIVEQYICDVLNIKKNFFKKNIEKNQVILKFFDLKLGKIKSIQGVEDLAKQNEVLKLRLDINIGDTISNITTDANRHGFIIAKNESLDVNKEINDNIKIVYEKENY